jgi:hypothetical protein
MAESTEPNAIDIGQTSVILGHHLENLAKDH